HNTAAPPPRHALRVRTRLGHGDRDDHAADPHALRVASRLCGLAVEEADLLTEALVGELRRGGERDVALLARLGDDVDEVGVLRGDAEQPLAAAAEDDRRTRALHGARREARVPEAVELALEAERRVAPEPADAGERLV